MLSYVTVGADDIEAARRFYDALLLPLGFELEFYHGDLSYALPGRTGPAEFYVKRPFNGAAPAPGNGNMVAFEAEDQAEVQRLHAAAVAAGGTDEGAPGFRAIYGPAFYVAYLRDPHGNKIALYSSNPKDPTREDVPS